MQKLKDAVRQRIIDSALAEFYTAGYKQSSMRRIANKAQISAGNIYAYFESKDALFDCILVPTVNQLNNLVFEVSKGEGLSEMSIEQMTDAITRVFLDNQRQFIILMNKSQGSKYENTKQHITDLVHHRLITEFFPMVPQHHQNNLLAQAFATSAIEGIIYIFNNFSGDEKMLYQTMIEFMTIILRGIQSLL